MHQYTLFSNDVETQSIWYNTLRDETGVKVLEEGMPLLLDIYEKYNITSTFFFIADYAKKYPEVVKIILSYGHEVASHGYTHEVDQAFDLLPLIKQIEHLKVSKKILEDISGQEVISFRAPALRVNKYTAIALAETGYKIDSSIPSQRFDMFLSFGSSKKLKWLTAPRLPYRTKEDDLTKKGEGPIIEVPLSAMFFPYVGTTMRLFPRFTRIQRRFIHWESSRNNKPVVFDIHPNEFIDESNGYRTIERRTENFFKYMLADLIRSKLKVKNLGPKAVPLYEDEIRFYLERNYIFTTIRDYCIRVGLLQ